MDDTLCGVSGSVKMAWSFVDHSAEQVMYISLFVDFLSVSLSVCRQDYLKVVDEFTCSSLRG